LFLFSEPERQPMFTGLIESLGTVVAVIPEPPGVRLVVEAGAVAADTRLGDSICVSGCCLSVVRIEGSRLAFEAGPETLARTTCGGLVAGGRVNLERSLQLSDRLGGHLVTGHVDGVGRLAGKESSGDWITCRFRAPAPLVAQLASKGSVAVDGVSLTVVDVTAEDFSVALIPHTLAVTTLGRLAVGDAVNLETDLLFKYVARFLATAEPAS
jgi:riboflavin synthase